jgi:hypothetical protein
MTTLSYLDLIPVKENVKQQYTDNIRWIKEASKNKMVVFYDIKFLGTVACTFQYRS